MPCTAEAFVTKLDELRAQQSPPPDEPALGATGADRSVGGVGMGQIFALAKACVDMTPEEVEQLLESPVHEVRVGAVSVMDFQARDRKTPAGRRQALFDLYVRRHDRINTWDLVDRSAIHVVGEFLVDKPRAILRTFAASERPMERRTAILSTMAFIRRGDLDDTYEIAERLLGDNEDLVHKAVGWMLREAGKRDEPRLLAFLDAHAATMPRVMLRYAMEKLDKRVRDRYLAVGRASSQRRNDMR